MNLTLRRGCEKAVLQAKKEYSMRRTHRTLCIKMMRIVTEISSKTRKYAG